MGSLHEDDLSAPEPLLRVMSLHALEYCERLFYLEEVEEIRIALEELEAAAKSCAASCCRT